MKLAAKKSKTSKRSPKKAKIIAQPTLSTISELPVEIEETAEVEITSQPIPETLETENPSSNVSEKFREFFLTKFIPKEAEASALLKAFILSDRK